MKTSLARSKSHSARDRILAAAYDMFASRGTRTVGVDAIVARSGVAKMTLYRHFKSKQDLVLAFLERRETLWTMDWLKHGACRRASDPQERLLAIFDVFDEWFQTERFEGCSFINVMLEYEPRHPVHAAAVRYLANIRAVLKEFADGAGFDEADRLADTLHILMKGSIVAAGEGNRKAGKEAWNAARIVLAAWPRRA